MNGHDRREHPVRELLVQAQRAAALVLASLEEGKHQPYALERREKARPSRDAGAARCVHGGRHGGGPSAACGDGCSARGSGCASPALTRPAFSRRFESRPALSVEASEATAVEQALLKVHAFGHLLEQRLGRSKK